MIVNHQLDGQKLKFHKNKTKPFSPKLRLFKRGEIVPESINRVDVDQQEVGHTARIIYNAKI